MMLPDEYSRVIAVGNVKGGVSKTSLVSNIGVEFATPDTRVLVIDMDPQGNLAKNLGVDEHDEYDEGLSLAKALLFKDDEPYVMRDVRPGLDLIAGGKAMNRAISYLSASDQNADFALRNAIANIVDDYELVVIDLPPGERGLRRAAFGASKWVLAPTRCDENSTEGVVNAIYAMNEMRQPGGPNESIDLLGIVITASAKNATRIRRDAIDTLKSQLGVTELPQLFSSFVRNSEKVVVSAVAAGKVFSEIETKAKEAPKFWQKKKDAPQRGRHGTVENLPDEVTAKAMADDMQAVLKELIERLVEKEAAHV